MYTNEAWKFRARSRSPRCKKKGQGCKQEDASLQRAMFNRLRSLAPHEQFSPSLSLSLSVCVSLFSRACIRVALYMPLFIFLLLAWAAFPGYGNVCFTFPIPYWAIFLKRWQCLFYFPTPCDSIVHDVCVYIYMCVCVCVCVCTCMRVCACMGDRALCMIDSRGYANDPNWSQVLFMVPQFDWLCDVCGCVMSPTSVIY